MRKLNYNKVTNMASSTSNEATDYSSASRGTKVTKFITNELKRKNTKGNISRITGLLPASPSAADAVARRRKSKKAAIESKAKLTQQDATINSLLERVAALEAKLN